MPAEPCVVPDCMVPQKFCHYCREHYRYFVTDGGINLYRPRRGDLECRKCGNPIYDRGHMLCQRCWNNTNILSEPFILTEQRCMIVPDQYTSFERWADIGPLNGPEFYERIYSDRAELDGSLQAFQRLKKIVMQLRIPNRVIDARKGLIELNIQPQELDKYVYCNLLRQGNFTNIRLDGLRERYVNQIFEGPCATGDRSTPVLYCPRGGLR